MSAVLYVGLLKEYVREKWDSNGIQMEIYSERTRHRRL